MVAKTLSFNTINELVEWAKQENVSERRGDRYLLVANGRGRTKQYHLEHKMKGGGTWTLNLSGDVAKVLAEHWKQNAAGDFTGMRNAQGIVYLIDQALGTSYHREVWEHAHEQDVRPRGGKTRHSKAKRAKKPAAKPALAKAEPKPSQAEPVAEPEAPAEAPVDRDPDASLEPEVTQEALPPAPPTAGAQERLRTLRVAAIIKELHAEFDGAGSDPEQVSALLHEADTLLMRLALAAVSA